ncbi:bifunctional phosphoglucose/phosphomannose isomerase [Thermaurantimonas aggregans]|uniref:Bifunctional phosphoglucose/phosphomannose isomerase n=1 Tax=Thermaurantimonas aggregans TaxID=2173829 RepID=A0A401XHR8_9FLAO|nr:bifunctional phosphoglucose/phosphomannose isomerase [Thermaurantimonas aggregans]MCX8149465.1 bifunctional phosphoglucose/phosphomannose isomerase [Thermaurantimonas aggregans]GCD76548.1 bifunctional phosphoglucose/phosphomannose isomerase [Thermaurantimonas aggregans]
MMLSLIENFPGHIVDALTTAKNSSFKKPQNEIRNVIITGLGGSGIGASMVQDLLAAHTEVPIVVNKDYHLPAFAGENTLVIACSYSGDTEETISALQQAEDCSCEIAIITSGGQLLERAQKKGYNHLVMPAGNPPRSMLGYSLVFQLYMLANYGISRLALGNDILLTSDYLRENREKIQTDARYVAVRLHRKVFAIYACSGFGSLAERFRQQLNENAKMPGWNGTIPEMNHNELVGWQGGDANLAAVFIHTPFDDKRNQRRAEISAQIISDSTPTVLHIQAVGETPLRAMLYLIHLTDWISFYLSELNGVDILDIEVINHLKKELANYR